MTTAICFDLDGTLVRFDEPYEDLLGEVLQTHLGDADPAVVEAYLDAFFEAFEAIEPEPVRTGMAAAVEAMEEAPAEDSEGTAAEDADPDAMADALLDAECEASSVPDGAREALAHLGEDAALGVISNGMPDWQAAKLDHHGLADHFDAVVTSYEAGAHKPDAAPFDLARERLPAEEYAMVGDDYEADVEGARAAGFVPIHYEESGARSAPAQSSGDEPRDDDEGPSFWRTLTAMV